MVLAGVGGVILFISILMFAMVADRLVAPRSGATVVQFATAEDQSVEVPIFDKIFTWSLVAIALALFAYAGPIADQLSQQHYLSPGMRTW